MKNKSKAKKIIIIALIIVAAVIVYPLVYTEYCLIIEDKTKATDIDSVFKVNLGSDFEILRTIHNESNDKDEQIVMVKNDQAFIDYLVNEFGCYEYCRLGAAGVYRTKGEKEFFVVLEDSSGGTINYLPYAIEIISGVTMEEIAADKK